MLCVTISSDGKTVLGFLVSTYQRLTRHSVLLFSFLHLSFSLCNVVGHLLESVQHAGTVIFNMALSVERPTVQQHK